MKIAVWGAGTLGYGLVFRLMTSEFTSEISWINRSFEIIDSHSIDFRHGLAFSPACKEINCFSQENAKFGLTDASVLVICNGCGVKKGQTRNDIYKSNKVIFDASVIKAIKESNYQGIIVVLTNPVDLMTRYLYKETKLPSNRIIGLGTVVETARLQRALSDYLVTAERCNPNQIWSFAIGSHDRNFVPVIINDFIGPGCQSKLINRPRIVNQIINEIAQAANRVKEASLEEGSTEQNYKAGTMFPIVEGAYCVIKAIALDLGEILTVSVFDEKTDLYYSLPANIGRNGIDFIHRNFLDELVDIKKRLEFAQSELLKFLQ